MFPVKYVHLFYIFDIVISVSSAVTNMQRHRSKQRLCLASFLHYLHLAAAPSSPSLCQASLPLFHGAGDMFQAPRVTTFFQQWPCLAILCPHHLFKAGQVRYIWLPCGSQKEEFWHKTVWRVKHRQQGERRGCWALFALSSPLTCKWTHISARGCTYT